MITDRKGAGSDLRVHIENDIAGPAALNVSAQQLRARLAGIAALVSERAAAAGDPVPGRRAEVLLACRRLSLAAARQANPALRWAQVMSAGVEAWLPDLPVDMILTNASGVHAEKGAEFILAACLMLNFGIPGFVTNKEQRIWRPSYGSPIRGRTVVMLGVGGIGGAAAAALGASGVRVIGVTRRGRADAPLHSCVAIDGLDAVLGQADILVSTLPLTPASRGLIDRNRLELLPPGAGVVVVGRAEIMDYVALSDMLVQGRLVGAVLDVFPREPLPPDDPLWACPRLVMTPHCSLDDHAAYRDACLEIFCDNVARFVAGEALRNVVDPQLGY